MLKHNGKIYARVSEILSMENSFDSVNPLVLEEKCRIGIAVHQAISDDIQGEFPIVNSKTEGYFESYQKWKNHLGLKFVASEKRYFNDKKRLTGQIDALILPPASLVPILVDFKTSVRESPVWKMQAHLYAFLIGASEKNLSSTYLFVKLSRIGKLPVVYPYQFDSNILAKCMLCIDKFWEKNSSFSFS